jgi:hypothetical protein
MNGASAKTTIRLLHASSKRAAGLLFLLLMNPAKPQPDIQKLFGTYADADKF